MSGKHLSNEPGWGNAQNEFFIQNMTEAAKIMCRDRSMFHVFDFGTARSTGIEYAVVIQIVDKSDPTLREIEKQLVEKNTVGVEVSNQ